MKTKTYSLSCLMTTIIFFTACNTADKKEEVKEPKFKEENISYSLDTVTMDGYVVYDENTEGQRPAVLVVHEWWGFNEYSKMRARELAKLGYIAMAVDMYGNGKIADNPTDAQNLAMPFYQDPELAKARFRAALNKIKEYNKTDSNKIAAIGYCFGGGVLLNLARMGENLKAVVSFHGSLIGTPPIKDLLKSSILVCHGDADPFVPKDHVDQFKKQMDSIGADYTFKSYPGATHAFTNPDATEKGKNFNLPIAYNAAADSASWNDMKEFFGRTLK